MLKTSPFVITTTDLFPGKNNSSNQDVLSTIRLGSFTSYINSQLAKSRILPYPYYAYL